VRVRALTWNLFHGRDAPPDPALFTWRSRLFRVSERNRTHIQVNRDLHREFFALLAASDWDVALLQECPPRWSERLAQACGADWHRSLTARNSLPWLRTFLARLNPDLIASNEGGSNLTLVRSRLAGRGGAIVERRELVLRARLPERRTMAFSRTGSGVCVANLHATTRRPPASEEELRHAAETAVDWTGDAPLIFGGDFNLRPSQSHLFDELGERFGLAPPTAPEAIDHLLARGLEVIEPPTAWPPQAREVSQSGLALRLSDHAPVEALFELPSGFATAGGE
jgi:endonuclease/exonuclease/phosphatase family metal-dependent hydrolase